jgi:adenosine deaminase CECR1
MRNNSTAVRMSSRYIEFLKLRQNLQEKLNEDKIGSGIKLSDKEQKLNNYMIGLRSKFINDSFVDNTFPSNEPFFKVGEQIVSTEVYRLLKIFPKGALLHAHLLAMIPTDFLIDNGLTSENCFIYRGSDASIIDKIHFYKPGSEPTGYISTKSLLESDPSFRSQCHENWVMAPKDYEGVSGKRWVKFQKTFTYTFDLKLYAPLFRKAFHNVMHSLDEDNIQFAELNTPLGGLYNLEKVFNAEEHLQEFIELNASFLKSHPDSLGMYVRHEAHNQTDLETFRKVLFESLELQKKYKHIVSGFDVVGEEDHPNANRTLNYVPTILDVLDKAEEDGVQFNLMMHGGETLWPLDNMSDLALLNVKRIGHGLNLFKYPKLMDLIKEKDICLEICPLSNQALGLVADLRLHPAQLYLNAGVPVVVSSDDAEILGYKGVTHDFFVAFMYWDLDLRGLKELALNSIKYSNYHDKGKLYELWGNKYEKFLEQALKEID